MQVKAEFRRSERFGHESIIKFGDDQTLTPYYALSQNLSETGMHFKSLFELHPGAHILIRIDDYTLNESQAPAKVVWCKKLKNTDRFHYGVGVEFLRSEKKFCSKASFPIPPREKTADTNGHGAGIDMEKL
jgi:hypothetical protein